MIDRYRRAAEATTPPLQPVGVINGEQTQEKGDDMPATDDPMSKKHPLGPRSAQVTAEQIITSTRSHSPARSPRLLRVRSRRASRC